MALYHLTITKQSSVAKMFSTICRSTLNLKEVLAEKIPEQRLLIKEFRKKHGKDVTSQINLDAMYGGMRGCKAMVWETSELDPENGITFRNLSIPEIQKRLPAAENGVEPLPEGIFWLLVTAEVPTAQQVKALSVELAKRSELPPYIINLLRSMPKSVHPMTQLSCAVSALNKNSHFVKAYQKGVPKTDYWEPIYEDAMNLIAKMPVISAYIYRNTYRNCKEEIEVDLDKDYSWNFTDMLGYCDKNFLELMRLYLTIHCDHEGGNVSAHTCHLVASALSDPYLSWGAGLNGLAGPLHGLANQEVLVWIKQLRAELGDSPSDSDVQGFVKKTLAAGKVIPGFGHAVLRKTDPRYICQRKFALKHLPNDPLFKICSQLFKLVPPILLDLGKVQNPWPNVDAHSGVLLQYYGLKEMNFYTVMFGVSRTLGVMAQLIWSRALGLPIERPKSMTTVGLMKNFKYIPPISQKQKREKNICS